MIRELSEEFKVKFECLGENTEKYVTFPYQLKKKIMMVKQLHTK